MVKNWKRIIRFLFSVVFCTVIAVGMPQIARAAEVAIDETNFPDENFRNYVSSEFDKNQNNELSDEEIANVKEIYISSRDISSLKGIEHFINLKILDCSSNHLTILDVSNNTSLTSLNCSNNSYMESLNVSNNTALKSLDCSNNQLPSLNVNNNKALTKLNCYNNGLKSLYVKNNEALTELNCYNNGLKSLYVKNNEALTHLNCSSNHLTGLDVSNNTALTSLSCSQNELKSLDVSNNTSLTLLRCIYNELKNLDVSNNTALTSLNCAHDYLQSLDVSNNTALTSLNCYNNYLPSLDVSNNTSLTSLDCSNNNHMQSLDVSNNTALKSLNCCNNQLPSLDVSNNTSLTSLNCSSNYLSSLDLSNNISLTELRCSYCNMSNLKLNSQTYDKLPLYSGYLNGYIDMGLSDLQNITKTAATTNVYYTVSLLKVIDITKPATYKANGKDFTIIYADTVIMPSESPSAEPSETPTTSPSAVPSPKPSAAPSASPTQAPVTSTSPVVTSDTHIFSDYNYTTPVTGSAIIYGNGINKKIDGKRVNNKALTVYTDILASYKHTPNSNGTVRSSIGKVIVAVTKTADKPAVSSRNKVTDTSASKIAKARIKNGQITVTAVGKEGGLVYLWVIDTGTKGVSACCPIDVKLAPKKLEVQSTTGTKLTNTKVQNGTTLDVHLSGVSSSVKTEDCTYTPTLDSKYQSYVQIDPKGNTGQDFTITAKGLKNSKDTKVTITFICDQNGKKVKFSLTITK